MAVAMDNAILENILRQVRPLIGQGKVADYIPALATVDGSRLGIAICTVDGQLFQAGDAQERFSIQSISKVLSLVVAMRHYSEEEIWQRVGKDPSGSPFNSLVQLEMEQGIPRNPFINAGALVVCDMLQGRLSAPRQRMLEVVRGLSGVSDISYDTVVARSEFEHDKGLVARMGGEEFAVAVPSVNPVDGLLMAEKIRKGVELQPFTWQQKTLYLTVSIGVGSGCASYRTLTDDFNKLMVEADTCLYRSKKDGRNRTSTMRYGEEVV